MDKIRFSKNFIKLHGQKYAELIDVRLVDLGLMKCKDFQELYEYDCKSSDGTYYPLNKDKSYCMLVFIGDKNIVFQTLRDKNKFMNYKNKLRHIFQLEIINT